MLSRAQSIGVPTHMAVTLSTMLLALLVAAVVGFASASLPAYHASRLNIVEGLRHIG
jgi:ABC-type antimicrobial peptide transport system permease subunit